MKITEKQGLKKDTRTKKNESGRSMVEMLGVLAIMGLLSIGGVIGYRWAMDMYYASATIKEINQRAVVYSQQMIGGQSELSSKEFDPENATAFGYPLTASVIENQPHFRIELNAVPKRVCQNIVDADWYVPFSVYVNGTPDYGNGIECPIKENKMVFYFHRDLDEDIGESSDSGSGWRPEESWMFICRNNNDCIGNPNGSICNMDTGKCGPCSTDNDCTNNQKCINGECACLPDDKTCCSDNEYWSELQQKCQSWDTCWQHDFTGTQTWDDSFAMQCQEGCDEGEMYVSAVNCKGPTSKGRCVDADNYSSIRTKNAYSEDFDKRAGSSLETGGIMGEEKAKSLISHMIVSQRTMNWFNGRNWCLAHNGRMATFADLGCSISEGCKGSQIVHALMALYGSLPDGSDAFFLMEKADESCIPYHVWSETGGISSYGDRHYVGAALCIIK